MPAAIIIFWTAFGALGLIYFAYPVFLAVLAKIIRRPPKTDPDYRPTFTVFIPCFNEVDNIRAKIENALALDYPAEKLEVVIADDGSVDGTAETARACLKEKGLLEPGPGHPQFRIETFPENLGKTRMMNELTPTCRGEVIVYTDANVFFEPDALKGFAELFADPEVGCLSGNLTQLPPEGEETGTAYGNTFLRRYEDRLKIWEGTVATCLFVQGGHMALRRELYRPSPPEVSPDTLLGAAAWAEGKRTLMAQRAMAWEHTQTRIEGGFRRESRMTLLRMSVFSHIPRILPWHKHFIYDLHFFLRKTLREFSSFFMLAMLGAGVAAAFAGGFYFWLAMGQALFYFLALVGWLGHDRLPGVLCAPFFMVSLFAAQFVGVWRYWTGRRAVTWKPRGD
jgi:cellulose synthase/poly-beta-1,6-N-acetylglucosamine synthase-like glycosyltransferase